MRMAESPIHRIPADIGAERDDRQGQTCTYNDLDEQFAD